MKSVYFLPAELGRTEIIKGYLGILYCAPLTRLGHGIILANRSLPYPPTTVQIEISNRKIITRVCVLRHSDN